MKQYCNISTFPFTIEQQKARHAVRQYCSISTFPFTIEAYYRAIQYCSISTFPFTIGQQKARHCREITHEICYISTFHMPKTTSSARKVESLLAAIERGRATLLRCAASYLNGLVFWPQKRGARKRWKGGIHNTKYNPVSGARFLGRIHLPNFI